MNEYDARRHQARSEDQHLTAAMTGLGMSIEPPAEWQVILGLLRGGWPGQLSKSDALAYILILSDVPAGDVARAVRDLARAGRKYRPTPPEIRVHLGVESDDDPAPSFEEAWAAICRAGAKSRWDAPAAMQWLTETAGAAVAAWAAQRGLAALWRLPVDDPDHGRFVLRDLERSWAAFAEAWAIPARRTRLAAARSSGGLTPLRPGMVLP